MRHIIYDINDLSECNIIYKKKVSLGIIFGLYLALAILIGMVILSFYYNINDSVKISGNIVTNNNYIIKSSVDGQIGKVNYLNGSNIKSGDNILSFSNEILVEKHKKLRDTYLKKNEELINIKSARSELSKLKNTRRDNNLLLKIADSRLDVDISSFENECIEMEKQIFLASSEIDETNIKANIDGNIEYLDNVYEGKYIKKNEDIAVIIPNDLATINAIFIVNSKNAKDIDQNKIVNTKIVDIDGNEMILSGKVVNIKKDIDQNLKIEVVFYSSNTKVIKALQKEKNCVINIQLKKEKIFDYVRRKFF